MTGSEPVVAREPQGPSREIDTTLLTYLLRHADDPTPIIAEGRWPGEILREERGEGGGVGQGQQVARERGRVPAEPVRLQQHGLGPHRAMGCGIFIPHKGIDAVKQAEDDR